MSAKARLKGLLSQSDNQICADCSAPNPEWASSKVGVFICKKCSGVHKSLGTYSSQVLSVELNEWPNEEIDSMIEVGGNAAVNAIHEAYIPEDRSKPGPDATDDERKSFIRSKYELQEFMDPSLRIAYTSDSSQSSFSKTILDNLGINKSQDSQQSGMNTRSSVARRNFSSFCRTVWAMEVFIGLLKIKVVKGTDLVIRDMKTSDPYVVLTLGQQTVKTAAIKSNLNPVWDEEVMLNVPKDYGHVKLQVFDHDTLSIDDTMGEAEIDIHPLISTAKALGDPKMYSDMPIGKWTKSEDNALVEDSMINIIEGKVKQGMELKLQNVETGELFLEVQWVSL